MYERECASAHLLYVHPVLYACTSSTPIYVRVCVCVCVCMGVTTRTAYTAVKCTRVHACAAPSNRHSLARERARLFEARSSAGLRFGQESFFPCMSYIQRRFWFIQHRGEETMPDFPQTFSGFSTTSEKLFYAGSI